MIQLDSDSAYGSTVNVNLGSQGIASATLLATDSTGRYAYVNFTTGPFTGQTLLFPFGSN
jgi:hypothetical protein